MTAVFLTTLFPLLLQTSVGDPNRFNNYLVMGYAIMFAVGLLYIASLIVRHRNVQQDIKLMQQLLQEDEETAES